MPWQWEENLNRYRDADTGRFISSTSVRDLVDQRQRITGSGSDGLAELLRGGQLNTRDWETGMREAIKDEYIQQYLLGRGGLSQMTQADWGSIGGMIADQYRYLDGFAREVAAGTLTEAQVAARSRMYVNSGREAHERARDRTEEEADEVAWMLNPAEHCPDCLALAALGWQPREPWPFAVRGATAIPGSGATQCLTNCQCTIDYRVSEGVEAELEVKPAEPVRIATDREAVGWLSDDVSTAPELSTEESTALDDYKKEAYYDINERFRSGRFRGNSYTDLLDSGISKGELQSPLIVYRGVGKELNLNIGDTFPDLGYASTSLLKDVAEDFTGWTGDVYEIRLPTGAHVLSMERFESGMARSEYEILLPRGSRFRVIGERVLELLL